jgi:hypothetical protein
VKLRMRAEYVLWKVGLRRLSLWLHREDEPLFHFQKPPE